MVKLSVVMVVPISSGVVVGHTNSVIMHFQLICFRVQVKAYVEHLRGMLCI